MATLKQEIRNEVERGIIVQTLVDWQMEWIPFREVKLQLIRQAGYMVEDEKLKFQLDYLEHRGYCEVKVLRAGRANIELTAVRATPKAIDLAEGRIAADPSVAL